MDNATLLKYPNEALVMGLQVHLSPRVIQNQGVSSQPIEVNNSILAGCSQSIPYTRAVLTPHRTTINNSFPTTP